MKHAPSAAVLGLVLAATFGCTPKLDTPRESLHLTGTVEDVSEPAPSPQSSAAIAGAGAAPAPTPTANRATPLRSYAHLQHLPLGVAVYEACSPLLYVLQRCPGRFLGEAKLANPGPFVIAVDTEAPEIVVYGFRGFLGPDQRQEACAEAKIPVDRAKEPISLKLKPGSCPIKLERRYG